MKLKAMLLCNHVSKRTKLIMDNCNSQGLKTGTWENLFNNQQLSNTYPSLSKTRFLSNFVTLLVLFSGFDRKDRLEKKFCKKED